MPAEAARDHDLAALCAGAHRVLHRALHRLAIRCAAFDLRRDALGHESGVQFRSPYFLDLYLYRAPEEFLQVGRQALDFRAAPPDDDAGPSRMDVDRATRRVPPLDRDA
jgi:hypothetical protein